VALYFQRRWRGEVALGALVFRDVLILGTLANGIATILSLAALGSGAQTWVGLAIFLLPLPYNFFLFSCVWRLGGAIGGLAGTAACVVAALWLVGATLL